MNTYFHLVMHDSRSRHKYRYSALCGVEVIYYEKYTDADVWAEKLKEGYVGIGSYGYHKNLLFVCNDADVDLLPCSKCMDTKEFGMLILREMNSK